MAIRNTTLTYGSLAKWLHWSIAILFFLSYCTIYFRIYLTPECPQDLFPEGCTNTNILAFTLHKSFGITIAAFVALRIIWRLSNPAPTPEPASPLAHFAAHAAHYALYFFMIAMPLSGWMGSGGPIHFFNLVDIPPFKVSSLFHWMLDQGWFESFDTFEVPVDYFHKNIGGATLLWMLIVVHAGAALYHHIIVKDRTLVRMWPGSSK